MPIGMPAVLDAAERVEELALEQDGGVHSGGDFVQAHERRAAHGFDDVVVDAAHKISFVLELIILGRILAEHVWAARFFSSKACVGAASRRRCESLLPVGWASATNTAQSPNNQTQVIL